MTSWGLPTCILKAEPGKLDIKRREPGIIFISLPIVSLQTSDYGVIFDFLCWFSVISDVIQKLYDLIKAQAVR